MCDVTNLHPVNYAEHMASKNPQKKEEPGSESVSSKKSVCSQNQGLLRCEICNVNINGQKSYTEHIRGKKHQKELKKMKDNISVILVSDDESDDESLLLTSEDIGTKCPYTQQVMTDPVQNKICGHNYEKIAICEFILKKKGSARCPFAGCPNEQTLKMEDLKDNDQLKQAITCRKTSRTLSNSFVDLDASVQMCD